MVAVAIDEVSGDLAVQCRELAHEMVRLEQWAKEAHERANWPRVGELHSQREEIREQRSALLRQLWMGRRRRRRESY